MNESDRIVSDMKILFITELLPYPPNTGGKYKTFKILNIIAKKHKIYLISFVDQKSSDSKLGELKLKEICKEIKTFILPIITADHNKLLFKIILSLFVKNPFIVHKYFSQNIKKYIEYVLIKNKFDLIYLDHLTTAQYIPSSYNGKIIYDEHDILHLVYESYLENEKNLLKKIFFWIESIKAERYERKFIYRFNHIFTISKIDKASLVKMHVKSNKISFLPIPCNLHFCYNLNTSIPVISFIGTLSWGPNERGIIWFLKEVYPFVKKVIPQIQIQIVGKKGNKIANFLRNTNDSSIHYLGIVNNLNDIYKKTSVFIVPIHMGGGINTKLLDALSHGMPVVTTSFGARGVDVEDKKEVLIKDNPNEFSQAVIDLIQKKELAYKLSTRGFEFIKKHYRLEETKKVLNRINNI